MALSRCGAHLKDGRRCWGPKEHPGEPHRFAKSLPPGPPVPPTWEPWQGWYYVDEQGNRLLEPKPAAEASSEETDAGCNRARATMSDDCGHWPTLNEQREYIIELYRDNATLRARLAELATWAAQRLANDRLSPESASLLRAVLSTAEAALARAKGGADNER